MTTKQKFEILRQYPLFANFSKGKLLRLAEKAKERIFPPGSIILDQNLPSKEVLFIHKGLVSIYIVNANGKTIPIRAKGPMYVVGELNIVDNEPNTTVETIQEAKALAFPVTAMKDLLLNNPVFCYNLLKIIVEKLRAANKQTEYYFSAPLKHRTWTIMEAMSAHFPNKEITLSQEELADLVGATRAKVGEALQELQNEKLLSILYKKIQVRQIAPQGADEQQDI